uniref:Uncharacterized protein n=1 Tax=Romanomermis culicivorax TaxID=13658 RepID=A0A915I981_ROMCU
MTVKEMLHLMFAYVPISSMTSRSGFARARYAEVIFGRNSKFVRRTLPQMFDCEICKSVPDKCRINFFRYSKRDKIYEPGFSADGPFAGREFAFFDYVIVDNEL